MTKPKIDDFLEYDAERDILTIDGIRFDRKLFSYLGSSPLDAGKAFQIVKREGGVIEIKIINLREYATVIGRVLPDQENG